MTRHPIISSFMAGFIICLFLVFQASAATVQYTYDHLNRLTKAEYDNGTTVEYTYDASGNRFSKVVTSAQGGMVPGDLNGDNTIDSADYRLFRSTLGKCTGDAGFIADADYDGDGCISYADYRIWYGYYRKQSAQ